MRSAIFLPYGDSEMNSSEEMKKSLCNFMKYSMVFSSSFGSWFLSKSAPHWMPPTAARILNCKVNKKLLEWECMWMASFEWFRWRNQKKLRRKGICCLDYYLYFWTFSFIKQTLRLTFAHTHTDSHATHPNHKCMQCLHVVLDFFLILLKYFPSLCHRQFSQFLQLISHPKCYLINAHQPIERLNKRDCECVGWKKRAENIGGIMLLEMYTRELIWCGDRTRTRRKTHGMTHSAWNKRLHLNSSGFCIC